MGQGTKHRVTSWIVLGSPDNILKFVVMKKCTLASQEFLKSSSKEGYYNPECPHQVSGNLTGKQSPWLYLNMARWWRFFRIQQPSLQTRACLKTGWGQRTRRRYSSLSTRLVFHLQTQFISPPLPTPLFSPSHRPLLPSTSTFSTSLFSIPSPFPRWQKCSGSRWKEQALGYDCGEARERGGCFNIFFKKFY